VTPDEMPAGREMDALVAEKVMGWLAWSERRPEYIHVVFQRPGEREPFMKFRNPEAERARYAPMAFGDIDPMNHVVCDIPRYSTEIAAAWEVVERLRADKVMGGASIAAVNAPDDATPGEWCVEWFDGNRTLDCATGDTAPLAICRAALKASQG